MTFDGFLTLTGILLTLLSIYIGIKWEVIRYKFNWMNIGVILLIVLLINFLILFDVCFQSCLCKNLCSPNVLAYIISYVFLIVFWLYIAVSRSFPKKNNDKIIDYYKTLIYTNRSELLMHYINRYHRKEIENFISKVNRLGIEKEKKDIDVYNNNICESTSVNAGNVTNTNVINDKHKKSLGVRVLSEIILDTAFIRELVRKSPMFHLELFSKFKTKELDEIINIENKNFTDSIAVYFRELIASRNKDFIAEFKCLCTNNILSLKKQLENTKYLKLIFSLSNSDTFFFRFNIGKVFYDEALKEIENKNSKDFWLEDPDKLFFSEYYGSASQLYLMLNDILIRHEINAVNWGNITEICDKISNKYGKNGKNTFACEYIMGMKSIIDANKCIECGKKLVFYMERFEKQCKN